jgi:hypothetical protein
LNNTATIAGPPGVLDPNPNNGSSSATTPIGFPGGSGGTPIPVNSPLALLILGVLMALAGYSMQRRRHS